MYTPPKFKIDDSKVINEFIREHPLGLLLSVNEDGTIHDTHTPFILSEDGKYLLGHIAKANPQWKSWKKGINAKVVFSGPHAYISPRYYQSKFAVPTWNYMAVSISGKIVVQEDVEAKLRFLDKLTTDNERSNQPWSLDRTDQRYVELLSQIVVFSISMDSVEASFKLNQNRSVEDQRKVVDSLTKSGCPFENQIASQMESNLEMD